MSCASAPIAHRVVVRHGRRSASLRERGRNVAVGFGRQFENQSGICHIRACALIPPAGGAAAQHIEGASR
jgi:hypothetical protein